MVQHLGNLIKVKNFKLINRVFKIETYSETKSRLKEKIVEVVFNSAKNKK